MNKDELYVNENPLYLAAGMVVTFSYTWPANITSPVTALYKDGTAYEDVMSGSEAGTGTATQTSRTITVPAADVGLKYRLELKATFNSRTEIKYADIYIMDRE